MNVKTLTDWAVLAVYLVLLVALLRAGSGQSLVTQSGIALAAAAGA